MAEKYINDSNELEDLRLENEKLKRELSDLKSKSKVPNSDGFNIDFFQFLLDTLPDLVYFKDKESRFLFVSKKMYQRFKKSDCSEMIGLTDFDFYTLEHAQPAFDDEQEIIRTGIPKLNIIEKETWADGTETYVSTSKLPLYDNNGTLIGTYGLSRDITKEILAEKELKKFAENLEQLVEARTDELSKSEQKYRLLADTSSDIIFQIDNDKYITYCSPSVFDKLGYSSKELIFKSIFDYIAPESASKFGEILNQNNWDLNSKLVLIKLVKENTEEIWAEVSMSPIYFENKMVGVLGIARDVNSRILLEEQNAKLIHAVENSPVSIVITNLDGTIEYVNKKFQQLTGYAVEEAIGQNPRILKSGKVPAQTYQSMWESLINNGTWRGEMINKKKSGEFYWEYANISAIKASGDLPTHYIAIKEDISERKIAEENLEKNTSRLRAIISIIQSETSTKEEFLKIALEKAIEITESKIGYIYYYDEEKAEFELNSWSKDVMKECNIADRQRTYKLENTGIWGEAVRQRKPILLNNFQESHPQKKGYPDGHAHLTKFLTLPIFDGSKIVAVVGVANKEEDYNEVDILQLNLLMDNVWQHTRRKQMDFELMEKNSELTEINIQKDKFFSIIAHDLRSPFGGVVGLLDLVENNFHKMTDQEKFERIRLINNTSKSIFSLLESLLEWSRSMLGKFEFNPQKQKFNTIFNELHISLKQVAALKAIEIKLEGEISVEVYADDNMLKTILRNIVGNAIKFSKLNSQITVSAKKHEKFVELIVSDQGVGMTAEQVEGLFVLGKSVSSLGTIGEKGTGLGLLICKEFIKLHRGNIRVESEPLKGSRFIITLPDQDL